MPGRLEEAPAPRRDFLSLAGWWTAAIAVLGSMVGMMRLPKPRVLPEASARFRVGKLDEFTPGTVKLITEHNVRLVATAQGVAAMSMVCTHLGCIVGESKEGFLCPCHGSRFDTDGFVVAGPAPRPLPWLKISQAANGSLIVDKDKEVPPGEFFQAG